VRGITRQPSAATGQPGGPLAGTRVFGIAVGAGAKMNPCAETHGALGSNRDFAVLESRSVTAASRLVGL